MYTPKVGDKITRKQDGVQFIILVAVDDIVEYVQYNKGANTSFSVNCCVFSKIFTEDLFTYPKEKFVPKRGETYYYPSFDYTDDVKVLSYKWRESMGCNREDAMLAKGLIFATKEEAIEARDKMIKAIQ